MSPSFGTSGLRGLVTELSDDLVAAYVHAFLSTQPGCEALFVGRDLRPSSLRIAQIICQAAQEAGINVVDCGALATPALALSAMEARAASIMVTGSHIPADRNGLKFYRPDGEISKHDEANITAAYIDATELQGVTKGSYVASSEAEQRYVKRYTNAFESSALEGLKIGVYRHSSVARDTLTGILSALGADVVPLGHADHFIPVDTEAVDAETRAQLKAWCTSLGLDAIASTDGDGDRPLLSDGTGKVIPGDILGVLSARYLGANTVVTPVSSNDMVRRLPDFDTVRLTRIGSPYVIAGMGLETREGSKIGGFEANGGFLLGFDAELAAALPALLTRDAILPILAPLHAARLAGTSLAELVEGLPACFTAADRLKDIDRPQAVGFLASLSKSDDRQADLFGPFGKITSVDRTDGLRVNLEAGEVLHLRLSGNAPEFRIYGQASSEARAQDLVAQARDTLSETLSAFSSETGPTETPLVKADLNA